MKKANVYVCELCDKEVRSDIAGHAWPVASVRIEFYKPEDAGKPYCHPYERHAFDACMPCLATLHGITLGQTGIPNWTKTKDLIDSLRSVVK